MVRRVKYNPSDETRAQVTNMAKIGLTHDKMGLILDIDKHTLYKYFRAELDKGMAHGDLLLSTSLFDQATGRPAQYEKIGARGRTVKIRDEMKPDRSVSIFMGKVRLGMKDKEYVALGVENLDLARLDDKEIATLEALIRKADKSAPHPADSGGGGAG